MLLLQLSQELLQNSINFAVLPIAVPLAIMGAQLLFSGLKYGKAQKEKKAALEAINNYKRQKLKNVYAGTSFYNAEARALALKQINDNLGTTISAAKQGGARTMGIATDAQERANNAILKQAAFEQDAFIRHQNKVAQGESELQGLKEARERADISGMGRMYEAANQTGAEAINTAVQGMGTIAGALAGGGMLDNDILKYPSERSELYIPPLDEVMSNRETTIETPLVTRDQLKIK